MNDIFNENVSLKTETPAFAKHGLQEVRFINVVSLFNGMGTLRQAFHNLGIKVNNYYSSEIMTTMKQVVVHLMLTKREFSKALCNSLIKLLIKF